MAPRSSGAPWPPTCYGKSLRPRRGVGVFELKSIHKETVRAALEKAERYRLLNEPGEAESICLDVLRIDPENQQAFVALLLALTDQFEEGFADRVKRAREVLPRLRDDYA